MARVARKTGGELALHIARLIWSHPATARLRGGLVAALGAALAVAFATYSAADPSLNAAGPAAPQNALGGGGAVLADIGVQSLGVAAGLRALLMVICGLSRVADPEPDLSRGRLRLRAVDRDAGRAGPGRRPGLRLRPRRLAAGQGPGRLLGRRACCTASRA